MMTYEEFFKLAKAKGITNIQITEYTSVGSNCQILEGKLEDFEDYNSKDYAIKAEYNNKTVKTTCNYLNEDIIDLLIMMSKATDSNYEDEYLDNNKILKQEKVTEIDISKETKKLKELDKLRSKEIDKLETYFYEENDGVRIVNSKGVDISNNSHLAVFYTAAIAKNGEEATTYDRKVLTTDKTNIDFEKITKDVMEKAIIQSNKEKLETKKYNLILDSYVAGNIISHLVDMLAGSAIRNKVSCLDNKLNKQVFSKKITIVEEPTNKNYPGYRLFDDEGTETKDKIIIDKGKVNTYLYNIKEAKMANTKSTGNGYGKINVRNMYLKPCKLTNEELLKELKDGLYITDYMGSQSTSINNTNGSISLQVFGFIVENGKIVKGFSPAIMTTTIFELLSNVEEIGNDLAFTNINVASPSILIKDISIAS